MYNDACTSVGVCVCTCESVCVPLPQPSSSSAAQTFVILHTIQSTAPRHVLDNRPIKHLGRWICDQSDTPAGNAELLAHMFPQGDIGGASARRTGPNRLARAVCACLACARHV